MALNKSDIVTKVQEVGFSRKVAVGAVDSLLEIIKQTLEEGDDVLFSGFGKFRVKKKKSKTLQKS